MSGFVQALRAYRDGTLSKEKLLTEVERQLAMRETDAVALMRLLNEEHARARLSDSLHGMLSTRIMAWCAPQAQVVEPLTDSATDSEALVDRTETVVMEHGPATPWLGARYPVMTDVGAYRAALRTDHPGQCVARPASSWSSRSGRAA